jgi:phosphohistidine phosphatase
LRERYAVAVYPRSVRIYLCRHAHAEPGEPDELRPLSREGQAQAEALGRALASQDEPPRLVLSSPLLRARQTAAAIGKTLGTPVETDPRLAPGATLDSLVAATADHDGPVATIGHQPDCSEIALAVVGRDPGFSAAAMLSLELPSQPSAT